MLTQIFKYEGAQVRTVVIDNEPWLVAKDLCDILEVGNPSQALSRLDDDEKRTLILNDGTEGNPNRAIVNEYGMYSLILGSRKPEAKAFKRWVTHEVLPQIRKTGSYSITPQFALPQTMPEALRLLATEMESRVLLEAKIEADRPLMVFAESLQISKDSILIGQLAKLLKQNGIDIGQNRLFQVLRQDGYLMNRGDQYNMPTQRSMDMKLMEIKVGTRISVSEGTKTTRTTKITGKGAMYFINKFKNIAESA